jgi:DNA helicase-2/ATP-dependent DNA helicase PcrA
VSADKHNYVWEVILKHIPVLDGRSAGIGYRPLLRMIQSFQVLTKSQSAYEAALYIAQHSGLLKDLYEDKSVEGLNRYENIQELLNGIKEF